MYSDGHLIGNAFGLSGAARQRLAYVKGVHWSSASWENFRPCQSNRCYTIELKIGESDYVRPPNNPTKFGEIRISGGIYRSGDFFISLIFFVSSDARPDQTRRPIWAYKRRGFVQGRISLSVRFTQDTNLEVFYPKRAKLPPGIGFPMLNAKSNCERTVRDRKVILSANPTKSRTANRTQIIPLTLDWRLTCFSMSSSTKIQNRTAWKRLELGR